MAETWLDGGLPYRDAWDHKPPFIYLIYAGLFSVAEVSAVTLRVASALCDAATLVVVFLIALGAFFTSMQTFLMFQSQDAFHAVHIVSWLMGSFSLSSWAKVSLLAPVLAVGGGCLWMFGHRLNVMQLDEEEAQRLGIPVERTRLLLIVVASLVTATAVAVGGIIGFVGLIVPHAVRLAWGPDHRFLLPMSALCGAAFLVVADGIARTLLGPAEIPVGVVTAFFGAPFFLYLLRRRRLHVFG